MTWLDLHFKKVSCNVINACAACVLPWLYKRMVHWKNRVNVLLYIMTVLHERSDFIWCVYFVNRTTNAEVIAKDYVILDHPSYHVPSFNIFYNWMTLKVIFLFSGGTWLTISTKDLGYYMKDFTNIECPMCFSKPSMKCMSFKHCNMS